MSEKYSSYSMEINKGLIDLLSTAQQNYELANERASSLIKHNQKLNKALDKACELIAEAVNQDCTIFDEVLESPYLYRTEAREWKEWLMDD